MTAHSIAPADANIPLIDVDFDRVRGVAARLVETATLLAALAGELGPANGSSPANACARPHERAVSPRAAAALDRTGSEWVGYLTVLRGAVAATATALDGVAATYREAHAAAAEALGGRCWR